MLMPSGCRMGICMGCVLQREAPIAAGAHVPAPAEWAPAAAPPLGRNAARDLRERLIGGVLFACAAVSTLVTIGIVLVLIGETIGFFREVSPIDFFTGTRWERLLKQIH